MIKRKASAHWSGNIKDGKGTVSTGSGALSDQPYGFNTRFEDAPGTNPEELIGAAHAGCFTMALSKVLVDQTGQEAEALDTTATVHLDKEGEGFAVKRVHLALKGRVPGIDEAAFMKAAETAKANCPISKLLQGGAEITLEAQFEG
ncbi:OsmC family protein [Vannielia litorea]|uniref:Osmotically inducible protein OsmC n=1 Tax=Vannielia litorea TaxID=1217970 RepID=A0A1N6FFH1_9RHOB|nr:OsmC family protein [Vannielia litorea]SIN93997.1 osmotically inducible protein OsmC [Vannielia litorea]